MHGHEPSVTDASNPNKQLYQKCSATLDTRERIFSITISTSYTLIQHIKYSSGREVSTFLYCLEMQLEEAHEKGKNISKQKTRN